jgi:hypothetical protein
MDGTVHEITGMFRVTREIYIDGVNLPPGDYTGTTAPLEGNTADRGPWKYLIELRGPNYDSAAMLVDVTRFVQEGGVEVIS